MVYVIRNYTERLKVMMEDKTAEPEEKKIDELNLPSRGLSEFVRDPFDARIFMSRIRHSTGMTLVESSEVPEEEKKLLQKETPFYMSPPPPPPSGPFTVIVPDHIRYSKETHTNRTKGSSEPQPGTSYQPETSGNLFTLTAGKTTPISSSTINMEQLADLGEEGKDTKHNLLYSSLMKLPELQVKTTEYTRFRYASERPEKGKKTRQYEMDEDKRFIADVKVTNHTGPGTIIIHCVDSKGNLHPYHLDGEDCTDGVYYKRFDFSPRSDTLRILKTTVIQPKAKEYKKSIQEQKNFLLENNAIDGTEKTCLNPQDKQCVHFHVKVYLDDWPNRSFLNMITSAIRNKKDGTEFKIHIVTPPSALASGAVAKHLGKQVCILVTQETAFPKDVAVVFRKKEKDWEVALKGDDIKVIRKAAVEFTPPPYVDPSINETVVVDVCLRDIATGKETKPVLFTYIGDEHGIHQKKTKKRKLEDMEDHSFLNSYSDTDVEAQKKMIQTLQTSKDRNTESPAGSSHSSSSEESTPRNSLGYTDDNTMVTSESQPETTNDQHATKDISLEDRRTGRVVGAQQSATNQNTQSQDQIDVSSTFMQQLGQLITSGENIYGSSSTQSMGDTQPLKQAVQSASVQQNTAVCKQIIEQLSPDMLVRVANLIQKKEIQVIPEFENLVWQQVAKLHLPEETPNYQQNLQQTAQVQTMSTTQPVLQQVPQVQSLADLPTLPGDCHYAIIKGQIMVVRNDIPDTNTAYPGQTYDAAGQSVLGQQMDQQQASQQTVPSDLMKSSDFTLVFGQSDVQSESPSSGISSNSATQRRQPPPEFWRAITGTSSNLDADDDIEIDSVVIASQDASGHSNDNVSKMDKEKNGENIPAKRHAMKLRGKKTHYKNALRDYEDALSDIKDSENDVEEEEIESDVYRQHKRKYNKGKDKRSQRQGKALYEDDDDDDDNYSENKDNPSVLSKTGKRYSKGKDIKLVKKIAMAEMEENSEGFELDSDS